MSTPRGDRSRSSAAGEQQQRDAHERRPAATTIFVPTREASFAAGAARIKAATGIVRMPASNAS